MAFSNRTDRRPLTHRHSDTAARFDVHMIVPLSAPQPLFTGVVIVMRDNAEHLSRALLDFSTSALACTCEEGAPLCGRPFLVEVVGQRPLPKVGVVEPAVACCWMSNTQSW